MGDGSRAQSPGSQTENSGLAVKVVIDFVRYTMPPIRTLWCLYFFICFFLLCWPVNALSLLFGFFLKQKTAANGWKSR